MSFSTFSVKSDVRQGGVCFGWLFNLYINELILKLEDSWLGYRPHGLLLWYDCLESERSVVKMCAEVSADEE